MTEGPDQSILMDTSKGTSIKNFQAFTITHPLQALALEDAAKRFPRRLRARSHPGYNCHGLTFGSRRSAILLDDEVTRILVEDGYRQIMDLDNVMEGDVVVYFADDGSIDHSGVVVWIPLPRPSVPIVCSKWGNGPEVLHPAPDVDEYAVGDLRYYRLIHDDYVD